MNGSNESGTDRIRVGIRCPTPWSAAACSAFSVDAGLRQRAGPLVRAAHIGSGPPTAGQLIQAQQAAPEEIAPVQSGSKLPHSKLPLPTNALQQIGQAGQAGICVRCFRTESLSGSCFRDLSGICYALTRLIKSWEPTKETADDYSILQALPHGGKQVHEGVGVIFPGNG